ncbi:helix-turn-helix domain-containing protein [Chryseobacterium sp.]|uniref:helix-turn-helix domain-containing protein n=1 Tax=Chryseobacterium sp. TaxID=1871047 RepID=UPI0025BA1BEB|nr:helix-turn-helix domain-containing protein [Chryseobacterium sp.]MBV8326379.1 helix-turn-helix transcriptional regulator [Chryseobacterium sp.]
MRIKFFLLFIGYNLLYAQASIETNLLKEYTYKELQEKFYDYNYAGKPDKAEQIARYYLTRAKKEKNYSQVAEGYAFMYINENKENALKYIDSMGIVAKKLNEDIYPTRIYLLRANVFLKFNNQKEALDNYVVGLEYAKKNNNKRQIALAETNIAYLNNFVGKHQEAAKVLRFYMNNADYLNENEIEKIRVNLADTYIEINKLDSANILINKGLEMFKNKDPYRYHQYLTLSGFNNLKLNKYHDAVESLSQSKKYFLNSSDDERNKNYTLFYLGESYDKLQLKEKAAQSFREIDSLLHKSDYVFPELNRVYTYLINYYKEKNDKEKQLFYIDRYLKIDQSLDTQFRYVSRELPRQYDTPKLLKEKDSIINELENKKVYFILSLCILLLVLFVLISLYYRSKKAEKEHRKTAQKLIQSLEERYSEKDKTEAPIFIVNHSAPVEITDIPEITDSTETGLPEQEEKVTKNIPEDVRQIILKGLDNFEKKETFLKKGVTLSTLAKSVNTNTAYLSEVINTHKEKNFTNYINDLRIDYALERLIHDKKFRSYKLPAIADDLGYNNVQAFSLAFKKKTGTTPSIYIKEIENSLAS